MKPRLANLVRDLEGIQRKTRKNRPTLNANLDLLPMKKDPTQIPLHLLVAAHYALP